MNVKDWQEAKRLNKLKRAQEKQINKTMSAMFTDSFKPEPPRRPWYEPRPWLVNLLSLAGVLYWLLK